MKSQITEVLTPRETARFLKVSVHTLAKWRCNKKGPKYMRTGRLVKYDRRTLEAYLKSTTIAQF
jgi:hypothetical protein